MKKILAAVLALLMGWTVARAQEPAAAPAAGFADTVFTNGSIYLDAIRYVTSLAVKDGRILATGPETAGHVGEKTVFVDLQGAAAYPGFHDSHTHLMEAGMAGGGVELFGCHDADSIAAKLQAAVAKLPTGAPLLGVGFLLYDYPAWSLVDLAKLDAASGDHPVLLMDQLGHNALANSRTLQLAGITGATQAPFAGIIGVADGKPTGLLREMAMILAGNVILPMIPEDAIYQGTLGVLKHWAALGYTSINDMMGTPMGRVMRPDLFVRMEREGLLPVRVNYMYTIFSLDDVDTAIDYVGRDTDMVRFGGCKVFIDGAFAAGQAWTTWTNLQGDTGLHYVTTDDAQGERYNIHRIVQRVDDLHLNLQYHVQGDAGVDAILDALDGVVAKNGQLNGRHTLIHLGFCRPDQMERMKKFGPAVNATCQPAFWEIDASSSNYYGARMAETYPIMDLIDKDVTVGISSDFSVSPLPYADPRRILLIALNPTAVQPSTRTAMTKSAVITGLTAGSAATAARNDTGVLEVGRWADLVVYNKDLFAVTGNKLTNALEVVATWVGGKSAYVKPVADAKQATVSAIAR